MSARRVAPPASDEQLAAAEETENIRRRDQLAAIEDQQEQERLAAAGDPEAVERMAAVRASASVLSSRPAGGNDDERSVSTPAPKAVKSGRKKSPANRPKPIVDPISAPQQEEEPEEDPRAKDERLAYQLIDTAYKKWGKTAEKDVPKANRALAIDLGKDAMLYLRSGIIRMNDLHATIEKLTPSTKQGKDTADGDENFDDELEELRKAMRGE